MIIPYRRISLISVALFLLGVFLTAQSYTATQVNFAGTESQFAPRPESGEIYIRLEGNTYIKLEPVPVLVAVLIFMGILIIFYASYINTQNFQYYVNTALFLANFDRRMGRAGRKFMLGQIQLSFDRRGREEFTILYPYSEEASKFGLVSQYSNGTGVLTRDNSALQITLLQVHRYLKRVSKAIDRN